MDNINGKLVARTINFHGQQLQKLWEGEYGENDLLRRGIKDINYQIYSQRQKNLTFQDRGKRLQLQQFIVKMADVIFTMSPSAFKTNQSDVITEDMYAVMPPFEMYVNADRQKRLQFFTETVKVGDLILGTIVSKQQSGMMLKVLCTTGIDGIMKYASDINVKAFCPVANVIPAIDKKGVSRSYMMNDYVCCEVLEVIADTDKMVCGMKGVTKTPGAPEFHPPLGLITTDDFPLVYKKSLDHKNENYETVLEKSIGFNNPSNIQFLVEQLGLDEQMSAVTGLRQRFPENEYATELRQIQASKWAYRNVADGIDHFKAGKHVEAFQCLNKALNIDPKNVEGLVARGALYANSGNFQKAIEDFETALKLNPSHANARKYMGETLVALGRSYEEENKIEDARKAYQSCLTIIPYHEEAKNSLDFLKNKEKHSYSKNLIEPGELLLPNLPALSKSSDVNDALKQLLKDEEEVKKDKKKKKKERKKAKKKRTNSSSTSSSSSSGSGDSSSSSSDSSSDSSSTSGDSDFKSKKKSKKRSQKKRENSLSPLSKRMAMMEGQSHESTYNFNKPASSGFDFSFGSEAEKSHGKDNAELDYEAKVKAFLMETRDDSDYETKVRKFLEATAKFKAAAAGKAAEEKKKKKKKDKKAKKENKKKKRKERKELKKKNLDLGLDIEHKKLREAIKKELIKEKKKKHTIEDEDDIYALLKSGSSKKLMDSLPDLEELESKLNAYYALEKDSKRERDRERERERERDMSESPKHSFMGSPSPTREQKARQAVAEASASAGKWKMNIGGQAPIKVKKIKQEKPSSPEWPDLPPDPKPPAKLRAASSASYDDVPLPRKSPAPTPEKAMSVRKQMALKEPPPSKRKSPSPPPKKLHRPSPPPLVPGHKIPTGQVVLDKFGNFRLVSPEQLKKVRRPPEPPGRPRSRSGSQRKSRSRSRSRSSSGSRSRSRSYRSRSKSYYSRSRSRSGSFDSRSRSRSRSYSGERRFRRRNFRGNNQRYDRGTYYKPRYPPRHDNRGRGRGGQFYNNNNRDRYDNRQRYNNYNNNRGYNNRGHNNRGWVNRGNQRGGRYYNNNQRGGYRDYNNRDNRRYDRSRSRDRSSRSYSRSPARSGDEAPRRASRDESKGKVNKYSEGTAPEAEPPVKHDGPLSEGEDRDDYTNNDNNKKINQTMGGKWTEQESLSPGITAKENGFDKMEIFLDEAKNSKKEEIVETNEQFLKNNE